jgi:hypothetical protein
MLYSGALPGAADSFTMTRGKRAKIASGMDERTAKAKRPLPTGIIHLFDLFDSIVRPLSQFLTRLLMRWQ